MQSLEIRKSFFYSILNRSNTSNIGWCRLRRSVDRSCFSWQLDDGIDDPFDDELTCSRLCLLQNGVISL